MAFSRKKPRRNMSITSSEFEWVHRKSPECGANAVDVGGGGCEGGEEVTREDSVGGEAVRGEEYQVLREGYLNMSVRVEDREDRNGTMARTLRSLKSTGSFSKSWKKRWCVLCRTQDGVSIFYYNKQSSYTNLDMPVGIFFLDECRKIFTIPGHPKSRSVFAVDFPYRTVHMYPEKEQELAEWLDIFKTSLGLTSRPPSAHSPPSQPPSAHLSPATALKPPKQKALRRDIFSSKNGRIEEEEGVVFTRAIVTTRECVDDHGARQPISGETPDSIKFLSLRTASS